MRGIRCAGHCNLKRPNAQQLEAMGRLSESRDGLVFLEYLRGELKDLDKRNRAADASKHSGGQAHAVAETLELLETAADAVRKQQGVLR